MASTRLAMKALGQAVTAAVNANDAANALGAPAQVFVGWPTSTKLSDTFGQASKQAMVSVWPLKGKSTTRYKPTLEVVQQPVAGVTASLSSDKKQLTIGGTPKAGDVVHAFFAKPADDAAYLVVQNDTTQTVATALAAAINALAISGITAAAVGAVVTLTGSTFDIVNVGGTGSMVREIGRVEQSVQVTVWANDPDAALDIADAIATNVGNAQQPFLTCDDGTAMRVQFEYDMPQYDASSSYSCFKQDLFFTVEYGLTQTVSGTQVGGTQYTQTLDNNSPSTSYFGGQ